MSIDVGSIASADSISTGGVSSHLAEAAFVGDPVGFRLDDEAEDDEDDADDRLFVVDDDGFFSCCCFSSNDADCSNDATDVIGVSCLSVLYRCFALGLLRPFKIIEYSF